MTLALLVLLCLEAAGTIVFVILFATRSAWRTTAVGRHLMFYGCALTAIYAGSLVRVVWHVPLSLALLVVLHSIFALAVWHRVRLVIQEQHRPPED